jgi:hypothetical protein
MTVDVVVRNGPSRRRHQIGHICGGPATPRGWPAQRRRTRGARIGLDIRRRHGAVRLRCGAAPGPSLIQKAPQFPRPAGMLELPQRLGLDLADALAGDRELLADLLEQANRVGSYGNDLCRVDTGLHSA